MWHQDTLGPHTFMVSSDLCLYVLDTCVKGQSEQAVFSNRFEQVVPLCWTWTWTKIFFKNPHTLNYISCTSNSNDLTHEVEFKYAALQNCSIIIRNVTEQDEALYHCLFNTKGFLTSGTGRDVVPETNMLDNKVSPAGWTCNTNVDFFSFSTLCCIHCI